MEQNLAIAFAYILVIIALINSKMNTMSIEALTTQVNDLNTQVTKIKGEIQALIDANNANDTTALQAAIDALATNIQEADDLNPDEPAGEEPGGEEPGGEPGEEPVGE